MAFTPRFTTPARNNKYYMYTGGGGYNPSGLSYPYYPFVLPNCFSGDTEVVTSDGIFTLSELSGQCKKVLTKDGSWRPATFQNFGFQRLLEVKVGSDIYYATANHRWIVQTQSGKNTRIITTDNLKPGMNIAHCFHIPNPYELDVQAIRHGFIYGDGTNGYKNSTSALLCGAKKDYMMPFFEGQKMYFYKDGTIEVPNQLPEGKNLPDIHLDEGYLYNFVKGYFAADGCVGDNGSNISLSCKDVGPLQAIRAICYKLGILTRPIIKCWTKGYNGYRYLYELSFCKVCLDSSFFINPKHRERFIHSKIKPIRRSRVVSVAPTDRVEPVYCAIEPVTQSFVLAKGGHITGNCVSYAWGRFSEILGEPCKLSQTDGGQMFADNKNKYETGDVPALGAMACWAMPGDFGHVAIVEQINEDGSIYTSNSGWGWQSRYPESEWVRKVPGSASNGWTIWGGYVFQGFIYNPGGGDASNILNDFIAEAQKHIGEDGTWTWKTAGLPTGRPWGPAFIIACAKTTSDKIINAAIPNSTSATGIVKTGVSFNMGTWIRGPHHGSTAKPQKGDLILFRYSSIVDADEYLSDHIGIVIDVSGTTIYTVEGDSGSEDHTTSRVRKRTYSTSYSAINGYFRPDWSKVGGFVTGGGGYLYTMENSREDAVVREIGYVNGFKPVISKTNVRLSVINYTSSIAALLNGQLAASGGSSSNVNVGSLDEIPRIIVQYLQGKGLPASAGIGIAANVQAECGFDISISGADSNGLTSGGMCQWNGVNYTDMVKYVGSSWRTNLSGQLDFLWYDMTERQPGWFKYRMNMVYGRSIGIVEALKECPNNESGARQAADIFVRAYENPANQDYQSQHRQGFASELWSQVVPQLSIPATAQRRDTAL